MTYVFRKVGGLFVTNYLTCLEDLLLFFDQNLREPVPHSDSFALEDAPQSGATREHLTIPGCVL